VGTAAAAAAVAVALQSHGVSVPEAAFLKGQLHQQQQQQQQQQLPVASIEKRIASFF